MFLNVIIFAGQVAQQRAVLVTVPFAQLRHWTDLVTDKTGRSHDLTNVLLGLFNHLHQVFVAFDLF
jgi:hypothetical protein